MNQTRADVIVIGAGISGLTCARTLMDQGLDVLVLEADRRIGGRIKSDTVDGFVLDHGFQVLQTAYPEARRQLDFKALALSPFWPGVAVRRGRNQYRLSDPIRRPKDVWQTLTAPVGTVADRLRMVRLFAGNRRLGLDGIFSGPEAPGYQFLERYGFSGAMIDRFFRPFFAGACLDPEIRASSRVFRYLFSIFAAGDAALPARGMGAIPQQIARPIPEHKIRLNTRVAFLAADGVTLASGEPLHSRAVVVATEGPEAARLLGASGRARASVGEHCLYFAAEEPPVSRPVLMLNGHKGQLINNIAVPSLTSPGYSASGEALIAVVVLGQPDPGGLETGVRKELGDWFGAAPNTWRHIKTFHIPHALPDQSPPMGPAQARPVRKGVYVCGEHQSIPGIQWALVSGRHTAEQLIRDFGISTRSKEAPHEP
jgi:phytoene dehydrogenase-like protein